MLDLQHCFVRAPGGPEGGGGQRRLLNILTSIQVFQCRTGLLNTENIMYMDIG